MGAWGRGPFANDAALDWLARVRANPAALAAAFEEACDAPYLEVDEGSSAVAAAAVLALAVDGDAADLDEPARELARTVRADAALRARAVAALDAVVAPTSELRSLWDDAAAGADWRESIARLRARIA